MKSYIPRPLSVEESEQIIERADIRQASGISADKLTTWWHIRDHGGVCPHGRMAEKCTAVCSGLAHGVDYPRRTPAPARPVRAARLRTWFADPPATTRAQLAAGVGIAVVIRVLLGPSS